MQLGVWPHHRDTHIHTHTEPTLIWCARGSSTPPALSHMESTLFFWASGANTAPASSHMEPILIVWARGGLAHWSKVLRLYRWRPSRSKQRYVNPHSLQNTRPKETFSFGSDCFCRCVQACCRYSHGQVLCLCVYVCEYDSRVCVCRHDAWNV